MPKPWIKRSLLLSTLLLLVLVLTGILSPYWSPWALQYLAPYAGVSVNASRTMDYRTLELTGVKYHDETLTLNADRLLLPSPPVLLARALGLTDQLRFRVSGWSLHVADSSDADPGEPDTPLALVQDTDALIAQLQTYGLRMHMTSGRVYASGESLRLPLVRWDGETLRATLETDHHPQPFQLVVTRLQTTDYRWELAEAEAMVALQGSLRISGEHLVMVAGGELWQGTLETNLSFPADAALPDQASLTLEKAVVPTEFWDNQDYPTVHFSVRMRWDDGQWQAELEATALPGADSDESLPPIQAQIRLSGDTDTLAVESFEVQADFLTAAANHPFSVALGHDPATTTEASLDFNLNLDKQPFLPDLSGSINGLLTLRQSLDEPWPEIDFTLTGDSLRYQERTLEHLSASGHLRWPLITLDDVTLILSSETRLVISGGYDLEQKNPTSGTISAMLDPDVLRVWAETELTFTALTLQADWDWSEDQLIHHGSLELTDFMPMEDENLQLQTEFTWQGFATTLEAWTLSTRDRSGVSVEATGTADYRAEENLGLLTLSTLILDGKSDLRLTAMEPGTAQLWLDPAGEKSNWKLTADPLLLSDGENTRVLIHAKTLGPKAGDIILEATALPLAELDAWLTEPLWKPALVDQFRFKANWSDSPVAFTLDLISRYDWPEQGEVTLRLSSQSDEHGTRLNLFTVEHDNQIVVQASGELPVTFDPFSPEGLIYQADKPFRFQASTSPDPAWPALLPLPEGWTVNNPIIQIDLGGTLNRPRGTLRVGIDDIGHDELDHSLDGIQEVVTSLTITPGEMVLDDFSFIIAGQRVTASGRIPMTPTEWFDLLTHGEWDAWKRGRGVLELPRTPIEALDPILPPLLRRTGWIEARLEWLEGGVPRGEIAFGDIGTFPLAPIGPLQSGQGKLLFEQDTLTVDNLSARLGDQPVAVEGQVKLDDNMNPAFDLTLRGTRVPLVRSAGLVVRANLDLSLKTTNTITELGGLIDLVDSLLVIELADLRAGTTSPTNRPPFFSVPEAPFADWQLEIKIRGDRFMRVRMPVLQTVLSAEFTLDGTLGTPFAYGTIDLQGGIFRFPFATFTIGEGNVRLTADNPYEPRIRFEATARSLGYDLRMQVSGTAAAPAITFSSIPALDPSQILLLVTTGQLPDADSGSGSGARWGGIGYFVGSNFLEHLGIIGAADRLEVRIGEEITEAGRDTVSIEYRLSEDWSVKGEYDRFDAYNLDFKWRIFPW